MHNALKLDTAGRSDTTQTDLTRVNSSSWLSSLHASASFNTLGAEDEQLSSSPPSDMFTYAPRQRHLPAGAFVLSIKRVCIVRVTSTPRGAGLCGGIDAGSQIPPHMCDQFAIRTSSIVSLSLFQCLPVVVALQSVSCPAVDRFLALRRVRFPVTDDTSWCSFSRWRIKYCTQ